MTTSDPHVDLCECCSEERPGSSKMMFHSGYRIFSKLPGGHEFYCFQCQKVMRIYAVIGLFLLALIAAAAIPY